jgi:hypothetical protein
VFRFTLFICLSASVLSAQQDTGAYLMNQASGTSMNPNSAPMPMAMKMTGAWSFMFMGQAFLIDTQETGSRGADKFYSTNYGMFGGQHSLGKGSLQFDLMLSLEPATITGRRYPELFQTGETAFGKPLVDAQHPHNFVMALGVHYARPLGDNTIVQVYFAPVGDPALGPVAFPHRASAEELPEAPLGHHWEDSTHIAYDVVTAALMYRKVQLEASGFYGTEPGENRWNFGYGPINSWSTRLSYFPARNWSAQVSVGRLARPERQAPGDVVRSTASVSYSTPIDGGAWNTSLIWGRNHEILTARNTDAYLLESVVPLHKRNFVTGRIELVDKDELFDDDTESPYYGRTFRIGAYTLGYTRDIGHFHKMQTGIGANLTTYSIPGALTPFYGAHPTTVDVFLRVRLNPKAE